MNEMRLGNIAGYKKEKEELTNIIEILNNREVYYQKGAYIPKGLILYGQPGNGKTLFAKVLANECNFTFYEFDVSKKSIPSRLKEMIEKARQTAPSIVFIDELSRIVDSSTYQSDSSRRNLSTLLSLLDGYNTSSNDEVFIVATTNDYDEVPYALVRPGRIDKKIFVDFPNKEDRKELLTYYINKTNCTFETKMEKMIDMTSSLSAAGIKTLVNLCVLCSDNNNFIKNEFFMKCVNEIVNENIEEKLSEHDARILSYQEIGRFIIARNISKGKYMLNINQGGSSKGQIFSSDKMGNDDDDDYYDDDDDRKTNSENVKEISNPIDNGIFSFADYVKNIHICLAGVIANKLFNNGPYSSDGILVQKANKLVLSCMENGFYGFEYIKDYPSEYVRFSQEKLLDFENKVEALLNEHYKKVEKIINGKKEVFDILVPLLAERKVLDHEEVEPLISHLF